MKLVAQFRSLSLTAKVGIIVGLILILFLISPSVAQVPKPSIPTTAKAEHCVESTAYMRRNHMELLMHQRDETMHKGIRTPKYSLQGCLNCHAVYDQHNQPVDISSKKHFCNSCHSYAAVKIDCFECHNSKPLIKNPTGI